jgi:hypothetical protein
MLQLSRRILVTAPAPALFDQRVIDVGGIGQEHIGKRALVLVCAVSLDRHILTKNQG